MQDFPCCQRAGKEANGTAPVRPGNTPDCGTAEKMYYWLLSILCIYVRTRIICNMYGRVFSSCPFWGTLNSFHLQFCLENWTWKLWNCKLCRASFKAGKLNRQCVPGHQVALKRKQALHAEPRKFSKDEVETMYDSDQARSRPQLSYLRAQIKGKWHWQHWLPGHLAMLSLRVLTHQRQSYEIGL